VLGKEIQKLTCAPNATLVNGIAIFNVSISSTLGNVKSKPNVSMGRTLGNGK
jgi:hypothetical protein